MCEATTALEDASTMRALAAAGNDLEPVDDDVNVADGRGPGRFKLRTWRRRDL